MLTRLLAVDVPLRLYGRNGGSMSIQRSMLICSALGALACARSSGQVDAGADDVYFDIKDTSKWDTFPLAQLNVRAVGYYGGTFDGRYVYFAPYYNPQEGFTGLVVRHDTFDALQSPASWAFFDAHALGISAPGFWGAAFDGRYVYFVPSDNFTARPAPPTRYDTKQSFSARGAWAAASQLTEPGPFAGSMFDGRYIYLTPGASAKQVFMQFDTQGSFEDNAAWRLFDASAVMPNDGQGYGGGAFDGRYLYFVTNVARPPATFVRYDTHGEFSSVGAWQHVDQLAVTGRADEVGFTGTLFDGHAVYLIPFSAGTTNFVASGLVVRYDVAREFTSQDAWTALDLAQQSARMTGLARGAFDGRHVYLFPNQTWGSMGGDLTRYDTLGEFGAQTSWSSIDLRTVARDADYVGAAVFDGQFIYVVGGFGPVMRFMARSNRRMPRLPAFAGSFQ